MISLDRLPRWSSESRARVLPSLLRLVVFVVFTVLFFWLLAGLLTRLVDDLVASTVGLFAAVLTTTAVMMRIYEVRPLYIVGLFANRIGVRHLGTGLVWGAGCSLAVVGAQWAGGWARLERGPSLENWGPTLAFGVLILLVGATGEELFFRGYAFQHLIRAFGPRFSILVTSAIFAWAHAENPAASPLGMVNTGLFGAVFGYAYWRTRDLWLPLGMHFAWNFSLAGIGANVSGIKMKLTAVSVVAAGSPLFSGGAYGPEASLLTTGVLGIFLVFLWKRPQRRQELGILAEREAADELA